MLENNFNLPEKSIEYQRIMMVMTIMEEVYYAFEGVLENELIDMEKEFDFISHTTPIDIELRLSWIKIIKMSKLVEELISTTYAMNGEDHEYTKMIYEKLSKVYNNTLNDFMAALW